MINSIQLSYLIEQFLIGHLPMVASSRLRTIVRHPIDHLEISVIAVSQLYSSHWLLLLTVAPGLNSLEEIVELQRKMFHCSNIIVSYRCENSVVSF